MRGLQSAALWNEMWSLYIDCCHCLSLRHVTHCLDFICFCMLPESMTWKTCVLLDRLNTSFYWTIKFWLPEMLWTWKITTPLSLFSELYFYLGVNININFFFFFSSKLLHKRENEKIDAQEENFLPKYQRVKDLCQRAEYQTACEQLGQVGHCYRWLQVTSCNWAKLNTFIMSMSFTSSSMPAYKANGSFCGLCSKLYYSIYEIDCQSGNCWFKCSALIPDYC